jgi:hypothetical protein
LGDSPSTRRTIVCTSSLPLLLESIADFAPQMGLRIGGKATLIRRPARSEDTAMSDWSRDAALRFAAQQEIKLTQDAKAISDQNHLASNMAKTWTALCELFRARCTEFNAEPGGAGILTCDTKRTQELKITRSDNAAMLRGAFDAKRHTIHFMGPNIGKEKSDIKIEVIEGSSEMCFVDNLRRILNPQDIVDISLTDLLQLN